MFGRKAKAAEVSSSRFCMRATELPYAKLYRYGRFTLAISKLSTHKSWPVQAHSFEQAVARGLLHGSATYPDHGAEEPLLPVELTFWRNSPPLRQERFGSAHFDRSAEDGAYILFVQIYDPTGDIFQTFQNAMQRALSSDFAFVHLRCEQDREFRPSSPPGSDAWARVNEDREFLRRVEAGEAKLEAISFDRVVFEDALITKAPSWTWAWECWEFDQPRFQSKATAKWRAKFGPNRLK